MATSINNSNTNITTNTQAITSINGVLGSGAFASAGTSATLQTKIAAVSSTLATSIGNSNTNIAAVSVLTKTNKDAITSINGVLGDGSAYASAGTSATLETRIAAVSTTMATSINNSNTNIAAVSVLTKTNKDAITSINGVLGDGSAYASAGTSATLETRIAAVSSTMATSIGNQMPKAGGTFTGPVVFNADGFTVNSNASAVFNGSARFNSSIHLGNNSSDLIFTTGRFWNDLIPSSTVGKDLGTDSLRWDTAYINTFRGGINAVFTTVTGLLYPSPYGKAPATVDYVTSAVAAKASVGTSATLETRIAAVSATMATSIGNSNSAITALSATMATSVATRLALAGGTMTGNLILNADPSANLQAASKQYVDNLTASSIHVHEAVRVETNSTNLNATYNNGSSGVGATLTNAGTQAALAIDGVTLNTSDRVLVIGQTNQTQNGVYVVTNTGSGSTNWILTRSDDADTSGDGDANTLDEGSYFFVQEGTIGAAHAFVCNTQGTIVFGTTNITFAQFSDSVEYTAGTGININSSRVISTSGVATTGQLTALSATLATSIGNSNTNITTNAAAITSINGVLGSGAFASAGTSATLQTKIATLSATMATSINNSNTNIAAVSVLTKTNKDAITSINGVLGSGAFASAGTSATLQTKINAVSATMATSIGNQMPKAGGTFTGPVVFNVDGFTVNSDASAVFNGPARMNSSITLGNGSSDLITGSGRWGTNIIPNNSTSRDLGTDSLRWDNAYINTFRGGIDAVLTTVTDLIYPSAYGKAPANANYVGTAIATKASVGTSATLETRIAAVSATMATSIATVSATLESRIAGVSAIVPTSLTELGITDGSNKQVLQTNGNNVFTFVSVVAGPPEASILEYKYTATAGQTTFSGADDNGDTLSYIINNLIVTLNGIVLENGADYTATNGTSIVLTTAAELNDELNIIAFKTFVASDTVPASTGGTFNGNVTVNADLTVDTNTLHVDSTNNRVGVGTSSPLNKLDLAEAGDTQLRITSTDGNNVRLGLNSSGNVYNWIEANGTNLLFAVGNAERMRIDNSGNVTIGGNSVLTNIASSNGSTSGYIKLSSGLIIQWGQVTSGTGPNARSFPISFPSNCTSVQATSREVYFDVYVTSFNTSSFTPTVRYTTGGNNVAKPIFYIATGY